jgi:hypothetical protein
MARQHHDTALEEAAAMGMAVPDEGRNPRPAVSCVRQDDRWRVELGGRVAVVDHCVGMAHLATLTAPAISTANPPMSGPNTTGCSPSCTTAAVSAAGSGRSPTARNGHASRREKPSAAR